VLAGVCPIAVVAKSPQCVTTKINKVEKVVHLERCGSFITRDSSEESAGHKQLELIIGPDLQESEFTRR
jgi:hypothetical protein